MKIRKGKCCLHPKFSRRKGRARDAFIFAACLCDVTEKYKKRVVLIVEDKSHKVLEFL